MRLRLDLFILTALLWGGWALGSQLMPVWFWFIPGVLTVGFATWLVITALSDRLWAISAGLCPVPRWVWPGLVVGAALLLGLSRLYPIRLIDVPGPVVFALGVACLFTAVSNDPRIAVRDRLPAWILIIIAAGLILIGLAAFAAIATPLTVIFAFALWLFSIQLFLVVPLALYHFLTERTADTEFALSDDLPMVSVLIPAYNEEDTIEGTIEAVLASTYPAGLLEIVVIDDGSTDATNRIAASYRDRGVQVYRRPNGGKHAALNLGLRCSSGEIVVTVDADSRIAPEAIGEMVAQLQLDDDVGCVGGTVRVANTDSALTRLQALEYAFDINTSRRAFSVLDVVPIMPGCMSGFKRRALEDAGGFSPDTVAEDFDVTIELLKNGWHTRHSPSTVWTVAPETIGALRAQRVRWYLGGMQTMWKHRDVFASPDTRFLHAFSLPLRMVSQVFVPLGSVVILFAIGLALLFGDTMFVATMGTFFLVLTCLLMTLAIRIEGESLSLVAYAPLMFVGYKHFLDYAMAVGVLRSTRRPIEPKLDFESFLENWGSRWEVLDSDSSAK